MLTLAEARQQGSGATRQQRLPNVVRELLWELVLLRDCWVEGYRLVSVRLGLSLMSDN